MEINTHNQNYSVKVKPIVLPLEMYWEPMEDITTYELALCLPYLNKLDIMPCMVDSTLPHFRHFRIIDHNKK